MTLQQLRYIIAIDRHRSFAKASFDLGITQPTLSALLQKLETELAVRIFERTNKTVAPTSIGEKIIRQAKIAVNECERITELIAEEKKSVSGSLNMSVSPSIAPYLLPDFIKNYTIKYTEVKLSISELKYDAMLDALKSGLIDVGISISGHHSDEVLEIPLYTEPFRVYIAENCWRKLPVFKPENLEHEQMWIMKESQCLRESAFSFCKARNIGKRIYEAGSIETLIRIVDSNGGLTIIPEMHLPFLSERQRLNVRRIEGNHSSQRRVSIYIRHDFIRQHILKSVIDTLTSFLPREMLNTGIAHNDMTHQRKDNR